MKNRSLRIAVCFLALIGFAACEQMMNRLTNSDRPSAPSANAQAPTSSYVINPNETAASAPASTPILPTKDDLILVDCLNEKQSTMITGVIASRKDVDSEGLGDELLIAYDLYGRCHEVMTVYAANPKAVFDDNKEARFVTSNQSQEEVKKKNAEFSQRLYDAAKNVINNKQNVMERTCVTFMSECDYGYGRYGVASMLLWESQVWDKDQTSVTIAVPLFRDAYLRGIKEAYTTLFGLEDLLFQEELRRDLCFELQQTNSRPTHGLTDSQIERLDCTDEFENWVTTLKQSSSQPSVPQANTAPNKTKE